MSNNTSALSGNTGKDSWLKQMENLLCKLDIPLQVLLAKNNEKKVQESTMFVDT